ncbi:MAG TPA: DUF3368 domain-containing protein [Leptospiraceae bacterium]|nr:DUF3368 domain-containing protein [Leptospiraceae bacterium]HRG76209.1 DUF3368 domain-containing protein [Leptospiraceae bacterium]
MPEIISNTSPILALSNIDRLYLLKKQFGKILIPRAVEEELMLKEGFAGADEIKKAISEGWISITDVKDQKYVALLRREIDHGESECLALAHEIDCSKLILDEKEARRIAKTMNFSVTGTIGILLRAFEDNDIQDIEKELRALQNKIGFFISESLFLKIKQDFK